jgi:hypothetical protein
MTASIDRRTRAATIAAAEVPREGVPWEEREEIAARGTRLGANPHPGASRQEETRRAGRADGMLRAEIRGEKRPEAMLRAGTLPFAMDHAGMHRAAMECDAMVRAAMVRAAMVRDVMVRVVMVRVVMVRDAMLRAAMVRAAMVRDAMPGARHLEAMLHAGMLHAEMSHATMLREGMRPGWMRPAEPDTGVRGAARAVRARAGSAMIGRASSARAHLTLAHSARTRREDPIAPEIAHGAGATRAGREIAAARRDTPSRVRSRRAPGRSCVSPKMGRS